MDYPVAPANVGHKTQNEYKTKLRKNTMQKTKKKSNKDANQIRDESRC
jgi:hypothetical protein